MPFTTALSTLTLFLTLAYILPTVTIMAVFLLLFNNLDLSVNVNTENPLLTTSIFLVVAFIHGFPCQLIEVVFLDPFWIKMYPNYKLKERNQVKRNRDHLISQAEALSINHGHYDQTLGEYILYLNGGLCSGILALVRLIGAPWWGTGLEFIVAWIVLLAALISLLYVSPLYKKRYIDILEAIESMIAEKRGDTSVIPS